MKCRHRAIVVIVVVGAVAGISYAVRQRRKPHLVAEPEGAASFKHPVLIIDPHSGSGKAQKIGLASTAQNLGIETVVRKQGEKIGKLAKTAVDNGCGHLIIAGGDGSLARVAKIAIERDVPFSCVPSGIRNHFAMDLGLDRSDPAKALDTAFGGVEFKVDVGRIGKHLFLNNVPFGICADAIAETGYREHKTESMAEAKEEDLASHDTRLSGRDTDGVVHDEIGVLLVSNNPYRFVGAPDFAGRARPDTGTLGVILADRTEAGDVDLEHSEVKRWSAPKTTVDSTEKKVFGFGKGGFAEYASVSQDALVLKPASITFEQAATVPISAFTAPQAIRDQAKVQPGQKILIIGASGGVGTYAVQIAKAFGAEVTGVCSTRNVDMVRSIGVDHVIDYTQENITQNGQRYDVILDTAGNRSLSELRGALTSEGMPVIVGGSGGRWLMGYGRTLRAVALSPFVSQNLRQFMSSENKDDLVALKELIEDGKVTPVVDRTFPLEDTVEALSYAGQRHTRGKTVVTV